MATVDAIPFIDWRIRTLSHVASTQDAVRDLAAEGAPEGTVVQALMQTNGRGRLGNQWASPLGNLYMSILLRPACPATEAGQVSFVAAVALSAAMDDVLAPGHVKTLKWPNDVLIDGKKCAGILLESDLGKDGRVQSLILGMGVNIMAPPPDRIGLAQVGRGQVPIHPFRDAVLSHFAAYYGHWRGEGFAEIRSLWLAQAHGLDRPVTARLKDGAHRGVFKGIDASGALQMEMDNGALKHVSAGEVYFPSDEDGHG